MKESPRHQCFVYEGAPSSHLAEIAQTLVQKLKANHRCLYLNSPPMIVGMRWHLTAAGVDLEEEVNRGALLISSDQSHLSDGVFDVTRMLRLLGDEVKRSLAAGFIGLWAAGDMTWEFGSEENLDKLLDYERRLDDYMRHQPRLSGVCLYHRDSLPSHAIETAMITHPSIYLSAALAQINPRYYQHLPGGA